MARQDKEERRRFQSEGEREVWPKEKREEFIKRANSLKPFIDHLITPAPKKKEKSFFEELGL